MVIYQDIVALERQQKELEVNKERTLKEVQSIIALFSGNSSMF